MLSISSQIIKLAIQSNEEMREGHIKEVASQELFRSLMGQGSGPEKVITYMTKSHYGGTELVYVTSKHKEPLSTLTNSKTLSSRHVEALKDLGFELKKE
jgi:hypothetical protein